MFLRYLYAALSAFIPLWSIFNHPKLVQWTKTLSSYVVPRLFLPPPDHLSTIGPLVPNIPKVAEDVNTSLALLDGLSLSIANKSSENHPLSDTVHILWGALVQVPQSPSVQLYTVLLVALGLIYLGLSVTRRFLLPNPTLCSKGEVLQTDHLVPLAKALALVGDLGHSDSVHHEDTRSDHSRRPSQDPGAYNRPLPAVLISAMDTLQVSEPVVPDSPLDPVVAPAEHYSLEVQHSLPCLTVTPRAVTSSTEAPIGRPSPEVSTVSVSSPIATPAGHLPEDQRAPQCVVDNQEIKVSAQPPFPPSPDMEDAVSVADSTPYVSFPPSPCVPSEAALVSMDCSIESEEPTLGEVDAIKLETLMKSQDTAPDISSLDPGDGGRKPNLDFVPVKAIVASDPGKDVEEPSLLESSQGSIEHISVLFSYSSTDDSIPGSEIRQPVSGEDNTEHSTMVEHPSTKVVLVPGSGLPHEIFHATEVPRNSLVNHGIANAQGQTYMEPDSKKAYESIDQTSKSPKRAQVSNDNHLDSSCQSDPGSVKADFNTDDDRTVVQESSLVLSSPKVLKKPLDSPAEPTCVREEGNESLKVPVGFPLMNVSAAISKFLVGEVVSNLDWTLINIQLNEEGKFAFEKSGLDRPEPAPDSVPSFVETSSSGSQASERVDLASEQQQARSISRSSVVLFASHSRSDSDLLNHRGISRDFGPRPRFSESHLPVHLKALTMRLGLILHETNFRMYEPLAELRYAIQGERTALALATIPRQNRKYVALPRYCFGLTREEFLGMFDTPVPSHLPGWSYADIARRNVPDSPRTVIYSTPSTPTLGVSKEHSEFVWSINKNRGGQEAAILPAEQIELNRQKAARLSQRKEPHPSRLRSLSASSPNLLMNFRSRRMSISGGTPVDKEQSHKDSPQAMSSPIPQAVLQPPVSASQTHQPPSNVNIGRITFHRNAPPETPLPPLDASCHRRRPSESGIQLSQHPPQNTQPKTRQRSASVSIDTMSGPGGRSQPASLLSNGQAPIGTGRRLSRFGRRSSDGIVHPPPLETIIGSPPDSPPAATGLLETTSGQVPRLNLPVAMTKGGISLDGIVGRAFAGLKADAKFSSTPTPTPSATTTALSAISTLSSTWNSTSTSTQIRNYARIDDEEAQAEAQRLEPHRASASLRSSIHAPTSTFPRAQAQGVQRKTMSSTTAGLRSRYG